MPQSVTIKDVARVADVSIATVSRVLNNRGNFTDDVRDRVLQIANELGYFRMNMPSPMTRRGTTTLREIGFVLIHSDTDSFDYFWLHILYGAEREARAQNMRVIYQGIPFSQTPYRLMTTLREMNIGGLLLVGPADQEIVQSIHQLQIPLVLVDNYVHLSDCPIDAVLSNNFEGAKDAVEYLIAAGHRRIAFIGGYTTTPPQTPNTVYTFTRRKEGYMAALAQAGLPIDEQIIVACNASDPDDVERACQDLVRRGGDFTAIFGVNDPVAIWAMRALREIGLSIPDDISVIGFDDIPMAEHLTPALSTVQVNKEAMGATALRQLIARVTHPESPHMMTVLEVQLKRRASVRIISSSSN